MQEQSAKIHYLDGIRGLAACNVLLTHFIVAFYPALYTAKSAQAHLTGDIEVSLAKSLWTIFYAGNISITILFVLSAYVLSFNFFKRQDPALATAGAYRRYLRLEIPVLFALLLSWFCMHFGLYYNAPAAAITHSEWWLGSYYQFEPSLWGAVTQALWGAFAPGGSVSYNPVLWTMNFEMLGSFTVFGFLALFGKSRSRFLVYLVLLVVFVKSYYLSFVIGMIFSDMNYSAWGQRYREFLRQRQWLNWLFIVAGLLIGSYFDDGRNVWSQGMDIPALLAWGIDLHAFYHILGGSLVLLGCFHNTTVHTILGRRFFQFLGRIAFSLYLLHFLLLCSLGSLSFLLAYQSGLSYGMCVLVSVAVTTPAILLVSYLMTVYVDEPAMRWTKALQKKYLY